MSEWMTTGEMVDKLKVGETAKGNTHWVVKKVTDGRILLASGYEFGIDHSFLKESWRIIPKYVSFGKAMRALKEGYTVRCYPEDDGGYLEFDEADTLHAVAYGWTRITWGTFIEDKWTIEENEQ